MRELCTVMCAREKCASARVQLGVVSTPFRRTHGCCYWLSAKLPDPATSVEKMEQDCSQTHQLMVTMLNLSFTHAVSSCYLNVSSMSSYFTIVLTICRLATCAGAMSANFESMKTNSTMLGLVTSFKMMMVVDVLNFAVQQIVPTNAYSTIPRTPVVRGQFCSVDASYH